MRDQCGRAKPNGRATQVLRCAIYTRVSTDHGLEQDFNSLDAQREASEAYIKSQAHEGWWLIPAHYDDGGFSGGSLERPALQALLESVRAGSIDVVVVYKVDRLTRSLADFAKLVELFDAHRVSFVSVTQAFNTTTSMGRLTLNVLLSFAQFEREVTGERIRDKIAASKKKGMWMGGTVPFGYRVEARKLVIDESEADTVRLIFTRYLELGSLPALEQDLRERGVLSRRRVLATGRIRGGGFFTSGPLSHLLRNRVYVGEMNHKGRSWPGEHPAIVDRDVFAAVGAKLAANLNVHHGRRTPSKALLISRIEDDRGNRMTPSHAKKGPARYRYYVSTALARRRKADAGSVSRVPAHDVERVVLEALRNHVAAGMRAAQLAGNEEVEVWRSLASADDRALVSDLVQRVTIRNDRIELQLVAKDGSRPADQDRRSNGGEAASTDSDMQSELISIPWMPDVKRRRREIIIPETAAPNGVRPMRDPVRANLVSAIARARLWLQQLLEGRAVSVDQIASEGGLSARSVRMMLNLAFLSPAVVRAVIDGSLPRGIGASGLADLPMDWNEQHRALGLPTT